MISIDEYLRNPCRIASIPYWKAVRITVSENMKIVHEEDFCSEMLERYIDEPYFRLLHDLQTVDSIEVPAGYLLCQGTVEEFAAHIHECYGNGLALTERDCCGPFLVVECKVFSRGYGKEKNQ